VWVWEQKEVHGNFMGIKGFLWGYCRQQEEFDGNSTPRPFQKIKIIPWGHIGSTQLAFFTYFILMFFLGTSY
jgi:hypothetical protein